MKKRTLSVVMATYNGERYLREQLDSVYAQTHLPDEVIVVDDCSTDGTVEILEDYHQRYGLHYIVNERNLRVNANFEKAIRLATCDYIAPCDQDDVWFKDKLEYCYESLLRMENEEIIKGNIDENGYATTPLMVTCRNTWCDGDLNEKYSTALKDDTEDFKTTILYHLSQGSASMFNKAAIESFLPFPPYNTGICYDAHAGYVVAMLGRKLNLKDSKLYYRVHGNNVTATLHESNKNIQNQKRFGHHYRSVSIVPEDFVKCYRFAESYVSKQATSEKIKYVHRIITLSDDISIFKRIWYLFDLSEIPFTAKVSSLKASIANLLFYRK